MAVGIDGEPPLPLPLALGHRFGPALVCAHTGCEAVWGDHREFPVRCRGIEVPAGGGRGRLWSIRDL